MSDRLRQGGRGALVVSALLVGLGASAVTVSSVTAVDDVPKTAAVPGPPPVGAFPDTGPEAPPDSMIASPVRPGARCGGWHLQPNYAGQAAGSTWWEYTCTVSECEWICNADVVYATWTDFYYWDGSQAVFYAEYTTPRLGGWLDSGCIYWWDEAAGQRYTLFCYDSYQPPDNSPPTAAFNVSCDGLSCGFDAGASSDPDGTIAYYSWNFGDWGAEGFIGWGAGPTVQHTFLSPGTWTVYMWVVDDRGAESPPVQQLVTVEPPTTSTTTTTTSTPPTTLPPSTTAPTTTSTTMPPLSTTTTTSTTLPPPTTTSTTSTTVLATTTTTTLPPTTTSTVPLTVPGAPPSVTARPVSRTAEVRFQPPSSDGGSPINDYTARCTSSNGGVTRQANGPASPIKVLSLSRDKTYTCTVRATNATGTGPASTPTSPFRVPR